MPDIPAELQGALVERYELRRGRGGMATVYLAHDHKHRREVALKVRRPDLVALAEMLSDPVPYQKVFPM